MSFAQSLALSGMLPKPGTGMSDVVDVGFLAPLSGPVQSWGLPGLHGCRIWEDWLNRSGGLLVGSRRYQVRIHAVDCGYDPSKARASALDLMQRHDLQLLMTLGGESLRHLTNDLMDRRILTSTLLPSDLSPDTPYLLAPSELHPIYNVTAVDWLSRQQPKLKRVSLCAQTDSLGLPSLATYRAAFKAAKIDIVADVQYDPNTASVAEIIDPMLAARPDIFCLCTSYTPMVHALVEEAFRRGFTGQILSCTLDQYERLITRTSPQFLDGAVFQFPEFDDPKLIEKAFFFNQPGRFYQEYTSRFPGTWSAVSWEYAAILDIWHAAVQKAGTTQSGSVLAAMKEMGHVTHAFGPAQWWGEDVFGIDNALVGDWPVVAIEDGQARIQEFGSIPDWLARHSELLKTEMHSLGQMWDQRLHQVERACGLSARRIG